MKKPKAMNLFLDAAEQFDILSDEQAGMLIKALLSYANTGEKPELADDQAVKLMFSGMSKQIDRDFEKYDKVCQKRSKAGRISASAKASVKSDNQTSVNMCCQDEDKYEEEKEDENEYKNEKEYENENKYKNENEPLSDDGADRARSDEACPTRDTDIEEVVFYLNKQAHTRYRSSSKRTRELIADKLGDNYTVADLKAVIDRKCAEWLGTEYEKYLRPDTLFGERFESYLNVPDSPPRLPQNKRFGWQNEYQDSFMAALREYESRDTALSG